MILRTLAPIALAALAGCATLFRAPPASPEIAPAGEDRWRVTFRFASEEEFEQVFVAGDFNGWNPRGDEMLDPDGDGLHELTLDLPTGRHLYKFTLDGERWLPDPLNPNRQTGGYQNSILYLGVDPETFASVDRGAPPTPWFPRAQQSEPTPRERPSVTFRLADDGQDEVFVTGDFNDWTGQLDRMTLDAESGEWRLALHIPEPFWTRHRFAVRRGEEWTTVRDPDSPFLSFDGHPTDSVVFEGDTGRGVVMRLADELPPTTSGVASRPIFAWLPPGYFEDTACRYPLLLMHDGQNAFDDPVEPFGHGGWHVNREAERLLSEGRIEPFVIVAVPNTPDRFGEYGPGVDILDGEGHPYARYLIDDVMPLANAELRTLMGPENTAVMGSSLGGSISFQLTLHHPEVFGEAACLSTAFRISDETGQTYEDLVRTLGQPPVRLYLDSGTGGASQDGAPGTRQMRDVLVEMGWQLGDDLVWHEEEGALHTERAWHERVWRPLEFLFTGERAESR